jgi:hypothetical protein
VGCAGGTTSHIILNTHPRRIMIDARESEPYQKREGQIVYRLPRLLDQLNEATPLAHQCPDSFKVTTHAIHIRAILNESGTERLELARA